MNEIGMSSIDEGVSLNQLILLYNKYIVLDINKEVGEISNTIEALQREIIQLNKDMVAEFNEEAQLSEIRKSEVMEAFKDVE